MAILKLKPACKDYIWGGHRLVEEYHKEYKGNVLAETWELSCHKDGPSVIANGKDAGKTLAEYISCYGKEILGENCRRFQEFPILIKFIDAKDNLSIQVHPNNGYALKNEGQYGKTEMWYVMDCAENAFLYYGFSKEIDKEEFAKRIKENTLLEVLNAVSVQKGDVLFIEAGTIHAIGKDILIAEIQQNSNVTYRVYDYGRVGKDGKQRDLHIEKALAVTNRVPLMKSKSAVPHIASCDYFTVDKIMLDGGRMGKLCGKIGMDSFESILILEGSGTMENNGETVKFQKGDSLFLPAGSGDYEISGNCEALITSIRPKQNPMQIGIDIGGTKVKIGIIDEKQKIVAKTEIEMEKISAVEMIDKIADRVLKLLEEQGISIDTCNGVGIGCAGMIDSKEGIVLYSNNLAWENIEVEKEIEKKLPIPVYLANDADCAALGEAVAGAARHCKNSISLTLGTGVGGGIILDGKIFHGGLSGGSELGHTVLVADGEPCTCGRKGCLEAYVSANALVRQAIKAAKEDKDSMINDLCKYDYDCMDSKIVFEAAKQGDNAAMLVVEQYIHYLSEGISNMVNTFRPEVVTLNGGVSGQGEYLTEKVQKEVEKLCFGGKHAKIPRIVISELGNDAGMIGAANLV